MSLNELKTYELTGYKELQVSDLTVISQFDISHWEPTERAKRSDFLLQYLDEASTEPNPNYITSATVTPYETPLPEGDTVNDKIAIRLLSHQKAIFWDDDADDNGTMEPLAFGSISANGLIHHMEQAAFTTAHASNIYGAKINDTLMTDKGKFTKSGGFWWLESGTHSFDLNNFYLITKSTDIYDNDTLFAYDTYNLFVDQLTDPVGNISSALID